MKKIIEKKQALKKGNSRSKERSMKSKAVSPKNQRGTKPSGKNNVTGIKKQYLKSNGWCNVTFRLPKDAAPDARIVNVVGEFNNWNLTETKMKKLKSGDFTVTLKLHKDREYKFRYLIDASRWENDWSADRYVPNSFGCDDSLVII